MKRCKYCNKLYPESEFGVVLTTVNKIYRRQKCKSCYYIIKQRLRNKYRQWIADYKKKQKCSKCGVADYRVLDFHHPTDKGVSVGAALAEGYGFNRLKREITKCIVICANCHRILHHKERNNNIKS